VEEEQFLFDTNSLLLASGKSKLPTCVKAYEEVQQKIHDENCQACVCWIILLECIKVLTRMYWEEAKETKKIQQKCTIKEFRDSPDFEPVRAKILEIVGSILEEYVYIEDDEHKKTDLEALFANYGDFSIDIYDVAIARLCLKYNLTLVTDDRDYLAVNKALAKRGVHPRDQLSILTANQRMLENKADDDAN
jgi:predicted nucleic acid-binding protein